VTLATIYSVHIVRKITSAVIMSVVSVVFELVMVIDGRCMFSQNHYYL